ncbi:MAG: hypothetical protein IPG89_02390 [Bacteroidetes bacterium]|nr:hypothetical protein [Bacteroidota bacterium]
MHKQEAEEKIEILVKDLAGKRVHLKLSMNPRGEIIDKLFIKKTSTADDSWEIFVEFFIRDFEPPTFANTAIYTGTASISLDELENNYNIVN